MNKIIMLALAVITFIACGAGTKTESPASGPLPEQIALSDSTVIVDVRTIDEFAAGHIEKSINIPLHRITSKTDQLKGYKTIITVCRSGRRSGNAKILLEEAGFTNVINGGSWQAFDAKMKAYSANNQDKGTLQKM